MTTTPCQKFKQDDHTGRIAVGLDADVEILDSNPQQNISVLKEVKATFKKGIRIF